MSYNTAMDEKLTKTIMFAALKELDALLKKEIEFVIGGGGAMILAHEFPLATTDIDAISKGIEAEELDLLVKIVAKKMNLPGDWLNPYFSSFSLCLPSDFRQRLIPVFSGNNIQAAALGKEDMLIMKCFAHRLKDVGHAKKLIKDGADVSLVEDHIVRLIEKNFKGSAEALDFLDQLREDL